MLVGHLDQKIIISVLACTQILICATQGCRFTSTPTFLKDNTEQILKIFVSWPLFKISFYTDESIKSTTFCKYALVHKQLIVPVINQLLYKGLKLLFNFFLDCSQTAGHTGNPRA